MAADEARRKERKAKRTTSSNMTSEEKHEHCFKRSVQSCEQEKKQVETDVPHSESSHDDETTKKLSVALKVKKIKKSITTAADTFCDEDMA